LRQKLERYVADLDDRLVLLGERSDVQELLQASDVFCQPNIGPEAFGLVFVEAMYAGLPVISTQMGGAREAIDATVGILVPPQASELASALSQLVDDPEARRRLGSNGPVRADAICGEATTVAALVQSIRSVLGSNDSPGHGPGTAQAPPGL
jgi:glycosyltransferase involved in cell wall biosynthesis